MRRTQGVIPRRLALATKALQSSYRDSRKALRFAKKAFVFLMRADCTLLKAPLPEVLRHASLQVPAHGQTFPTPERVEGERYRMPVRKLRASPLRVLAEEIPSRFILFG